MGDYEKSQDVGAPAGQLFGYLSDIAFSAALLVANTNSAAASADSTTKWISRSTAISRRT